MASLLFLILVVLLFKILNPYISDISILYKTKTTVIRI